MHQPQASSIVHQTWTGNSFHTRYFTCFKHSYVLGVLSVVYLILTTIFKIGLISSVYKGTDQGFHRINGLPKVKTAYQVALMLKNSPADAGGVSEACLIPGSGRSPEEENGNPLQYSCLENPMNGGAWRATVHRVTKSQTQLTTKLACTHGFRKQGTGTLESLSDFHRHHSSFASHSQEGWGENCA